MLHSVSDAYIKISIFLGVFGVIVLWQAILRHKKVRKIQDTASTKIASAPQGYVEIQGFAWPIQKGIKSSEGFELVYYRVSLEKEVRRNKQTTWVKVFSDGFVKPFYIVDPTGLVIVDPSTAEIESGHIKTRSWRSLKKEEQDFYLNNIFPKDIKNFPPSNRFGIFSTKYRIVETEIRTGSPIYVAGEFKTHNAEIRRVTTVGLTQFCNRVMDFNSLNFKKLDALLDKNNDGKVTYKEARDGYAVAAELSKKRTELEKIQEKEFEVYGVLAGSVNHKLYLADSHEAHVVQRLQKGFFLRLVGGVVMLSISLFMIVRIFISDDEINDMMTFRVPKSRQVVAESNLPQMQLWLNKLHGGCFKGNLKSCSDLIEAQEYYGLRDEDIQMYKTQACKLGSQEHCNN